MDGLGPVTGKNNVFQRQPGFKVPRERGTWSLVKYPDGSRPIICCPCCGAAAVLKLHSVDSAGKVTPSVGLRPCGYHEFITLEGWED